MSIQFWQNLCAHLSALLHLHFLTLQYMFTHCLVNLNVHIAAKNVLVAACPRGLKFSAYLVMIVGYYVTVVICCLTLLSQGTDHVKSTNCDKQNFIL